MNRPKKEHYNAASYLAGFTKAGTEDGHLYVFDQELGKSWPSSPRESGARNHFYDVDLGPSIEPTLIETDVLAPLDGEFRGVIKRCIDTEVLPNGSAFDILLTFVAFQSATVPRIRELTRIITDLCMNLSLQTDLPTAKGSQVTT